MYKTNPVAYFMGYTVQFFAHLYAFNKVHIDGLVQDCSATLRESIPRLFNGGTTTMTTRCAPPSQTPGGLGQRYWSVSEVTWPPKLEFRRWGSSGPSSLMNACTDVTAVLHYAIDLNLSLKIRLSLDMLQFCMDLCILFVFRINSSFSSAIYIGLCEQNTGQDR